MDHQIVTVNLPASLLREVKHMAVDRGVSLSRFIVLLLEQEVQARRHYQAAQDRQFSLLHAGLPLGTYGRISCERSEIYER